jgi:hypothetical protein
VHCEIFICKYPREVGSLVGFVTKEVVLPRRKPNYCEIHGKEHIVLQELKPGGKYHSEVVCNYSDRRGSCGHNKSLKESQVKYMLRKYPNCEIQPYGQRPYDFFFGDE